MSPYHVTEPHPSVSRSKQQAYIFSGRGGAGNMYRYDTSILTSGPSATGPASRAALPSPPTTARAMLTGRGGAGNAVHRPTAVATPSSSAAAPAPSALQQSAKSRASSDSARSPSQHAIFSFDEELQRDQRMLDNAARATLIGRGGAGNYAVPSTAAPPATQARKSSASSVRSAASASTTGSERRKGLSGALGRLSRTISSRS